MIKKIDSGAVAILGALMGLAGDYLVLALNLYDQHPVVATCLFVFSTGLATFAIVSWVRHKGNSAHPQSGAGETSTFLGTHIGESTAYVESTAQHVAEDSIFGKLGGRIRHQPRKD